MPLTLIKTMEEDIKNLKNEKASSEAERALDKKTLEDLRDEVASLKKDAKRNAIPDAKILDMTSLKALASDLYLKSIFTGKPASSFKEYATIETAVTKAMIPTDVPAWLAEEFSNDILTRLELDRKVEGLFTKLSLPTNRSEFSIPAKTNDLRAYLIAPAQDAIQSALTAGKVTFKTRRIKAMVSFADQADDEAVVTIVPMLKEELIATLARATEEALIMGDTATVDANDVKKSFDGLLKQAVVAGNRVDGAGLISLASLTNSRKKLGAYGISLSSLVLVVSVDTYYDMLVNIPEIITADKYGNSATVLTGEVAKLAGVSILVSEYLPHTLDANGAIGGTKTAGLLINRNYFAVGVRGGVALEQDRNIVNSTDTFVAFRDFDFKKLAIGVTPVCAITNLN